MFGEPRQSFPRLVNVPGFDVLVEGAVDMQHVRPLERDEARRIKRRQRRLSQCSEHVRWVVEIDPFDRTSIPKKRTALGRFAHEGAILGPVKAGEPLVFYMGCDARNEYIYKYVSNRRWDPRDANEGMAGGDKYLDDGKLYVARFNADGFGEWRELSFGMNNISADNRSVASI